MEKNKSEFKYAFLLVSTHPIDKMFVGAGKAPKGAEYVCEILADKAVTVPEKYLLKRFKSFKNGNFV